jgi:TolA-binding protein
MHRTVSALAAAAILAWCAAPALSQQTPPQPAATAQPPATNPNRTATTQTVPQPPQANYAQLLAALNRSRGAVAQLRAMNNLTTNNLHIVKVQTIVTPDNMAEFNATLARNQTQLAALRQQLAATRVVATTDNSTITLAQFLTDNKIAPSQVVAVDVGASDVTIFIQ